MRTFKKNSREELRLFFLDASQDDWDLNTALSEKDNLDWEDDKLEDDFFVDNYVENFERYK